ncbi:MULTISPECIES: glycosyltransferase family 39 protein [Rhodomicrobium]|uniref:glycosyltransferase family 39 protein n=1 Tax=Rhodomicrobium TaxID=1068 RepID=UPI000B4AFD15|nr:MULTISPECIES: glycosyltransferase family 39 protein [Rhodomicrobium]
MPDQPLERIARWTPLFILTYFTAQFLIRVTLSGNLEIDEAQFVGETYLALGYGNSHPPLYNWLVAGCVWLMGGYWPAGVALLKNLLLAGTYLLGFDIARRVTGRALTGLILVASFLLLPQVVWKSQITLAHTTLVMFAVVAVLHAVVCIAERPDARNYLWLGLAAAIGGLAKYNFFLMLVAILIAAASIPYLRARLFTRKLAYSIALFAVLFAPHLIWAAQNIAQSTQRMAKLERSNDLFGGIDIPWLGLDGFLASLVALAAWTGPLLLAWFAIRHFSTAKPEEPSPPSSERTQAFMQLFGRSAAIGLGTFLAIVLFGDLHTVFERYFTPILITVPLWLVLAWPMEGHGRAPLHFLRLGALVALLMVTAWPAWIGFGREQLAYPYESFAATIGERASGPFAILAQQRRAAANLAIRLDRASVWEEGSRPDQVVLLWDGRQDAPPKDLIEQLGTGFEPRGAPLKMSYPYDNFSGHRAGLNAWVYARKP